MGQNNIQSEGSDYEQLTDSTPRPAVVDVRRAVSESTPSAPVQRLDRVRQGVRYGLALAGALFISTVGENPKNNPDDVAPVSAPAAAPAATPSQEPAPANWQLFNMAHDNRTFNIDVNYGSSLTYRVEDLADNTNFKEITTILEDGKTRVRAVVKLDKPVEEGVRYSVRLADNPDKKPEGLNADGIAPLPQHPLE